MDDIWAHIRYLTAWLDRSSAPHPGDYRVLRCFKVAEELGEVTAAIIGVTGQNPRKGVTHTWNDVRDELCDVILAAMVALQSVAGDSAEAALQKYAETRHDRAVKLVNACD
jgi:NTP pyrophosphatase (non-canonical NTP hydrolase)